jgi:hydrogenase nickel incorporation protein HypA/HybF
MVQEESMHELSIASSIVEAVTETAAAYPGARVKEVRLRVGALASIVEDSLKFCWELATDDSPLQGSALVVKILPVIVHCGACGRDTELDGVQSFRCAQCGEIAAVFLQGRELEIESIELEDPEPATGETAKLKEQA